MGSRRRETLSDQIRRAVLDSDLTRYRIWQETGIDQAALSRFVRGDAGLSLDALDRLADLLDLNIVAGRRRRSRPRR
ncbi:MAG: helix-turn-helix domain-containing protein [Planctomycetota bacterium]|jgi:hypothetical protein